MENLINIVAEVIEPEFDGEGIANYGEPDGVYESNLDEESEMEMLRR